MRKPLQCSLQPSPVWPLGRSSTRKKVERRWAKHGSFVVLEDDLLIYCGIRQGDRLVDVCDRRESNLPISGGPPPDHFPTSPETASFPGISDKALDNVLDAVVGIAMVPFDQFPSGCEAHPLV